MLTINNMLKFDKLSASIINTWECVKNSCQSKQLLNRPTSANEHVTLRVGLP